MDTKGIPLENILMTLNKEEYVIDWLEFILTSVENKWKLKSTLTKIEVSLTEVYGKEHSLKIMSILNYGCKKYINYL